MTFAIVFYRFLLYSVSRSAFLVAKKNIQNIIESSLTCHNPLIVFQKNKKNQVIWGKEKDGKGVELSECDLFLDYFVLSAAGLFNDTSHLNSVSILNNLLLSMWQLLRLTSISNETSNLTTLTEIFQWYCKDAAL